MKGHVLFTTLISISLVHSMEKPSTIQTPSTTSKTITKKELVKLVKNKDARGVLFAITHQNAAKVIDKKVIQIAEDQKEDQLTLSRTGSIFSMIIKHAPPHEEKKQNPPSSSGKSLNLKHHHHSSKKHKKERTPKEQLLRMIRKKNLEGIKEFTRTSSVHFIDNEAVEYARKKYELLCDSSDIKKDLSNSTEYLILQLLKKYTPASYKERRKSCIIKPHSPKDAKP